MSSHPDPATPHAAPEPFIQIKASAGSGKTYALTRRFLALLRQADANPAPLCRRAPGERYGWQELLAITFTNKAAAEMKERVISALKHRALGRPGSSPAGDYDPARARTDLARLLRRFESLNIRTIDSLLNLLARLFALELGIDPDFELAMDEDAVFDGLWQRLVDRLEVGDPRVAELWGQALDNVLHIENRPGFDLADRIKDQVRQAFAHLLEAGPEGSAQSLCEDTELMQQRVQAAFAAFMQATQALEARITAEGAATSHYFAKALDACLCAGLYDGPPDSKTLRHEDPAACLLVKSRHLAPALEPDWQAFREGHDAYRAILASYGKALLLAPALGLARELIAGWDNPETADKVLPISRLAGLVRQALAENAPPEAFCRLGARLHHLLIDEFQDTSRPQWAALLPLAEECLAKGGSLFYVGDVKQAIYGWRGGDASLFEEIAATGDLPRLAVPIRENLPDNWRSDQTIVAFNNEFFSRLEQPEPCLSAAATMLGEEAPEEEAHALADELGQAFAACRQRLPEKERSGEGWVQLDVLPGGDEFDEVLREAVTGRIRELLNRRQAREIAVLVRSNAEARMVADWCIAMRVPVVTDNSLMVARHPLVRQLTALLHLIDYPEDELALFELLTGPDLLAGLESGGLSADRALEWFAGLPRSGADQAGRRSPMACLQRDFSELWRVWLEPFVRAAGLMSPYDLVREVLRVFRLEERRPRDAAYLLRFLEIVHLAEEQGMSSLTAFLEYWQEHGHEEKVPLPEAMDAVRVLTIHKAKGLQFPVVLAPFHAWPVRAGGELTVVERDGLRLLTTMSKDLGPHYWRHRRELAREQANLLYVAWTRAEHELHLLLPPEGGSSGPALEMIRSLLGDELPEADHDQGLRLGSVPADFREWQPDPVQPPAPGLAMPEASTPVRLMEWLPRLRIYQRLEEVDTRAKVRGELVHRAVELVLAEPDPSVAARRAALEALAEFPEYAGDPEGFTAEFGELFAWLLSQPEVPEWFARGTREAPFLDAEGKVKRMDLHYESEAEVVVVDFKTGQANPSHRRQVVEYLALAGALAPGKAVRGVLVYLDERRLERVTPSETDPSGEARP